MAHAMYKDRYKDWTVAVMAIEDPQRLEPLLALSETLVNFGLAVHVFAPISVRQRVQTLGAVWCHYGKEDWSLHKHAAAMAKDLLQVDLDMDFLRASTNIGFSVLPACLGLVPYLIGQMARLQPRIVIFDAAAPWGHVVSEILGIPAVCSHSSIPLTADEREAYSKRWPEHLTSTLEKTVDLLSSTYGVELNQNHCCSNYTPYTIVWQTSSWVQDKTEAKAFNFWGPCRPMPRAAPEEGRWANGKPLVFVHLGELVLFERFPGLKPVVRDFYDKLCKAATLLKDVSFLLSAGRDTPLVSKGSKVTALFESIAVPENLSVERNVAPSEVLREAKVFVTACDEAYLYDAVARKVPMVACPLLAEQFSLAQRVTNLGYGVWQPYCAAGPVEPPGQPGDSLVSPESLARAIRRVLSEPSCLAQLTIASALQAKEASVPLDSDDRVAGMLAHFRRLGV